MLESLHLGSWLRLLRPGSPWLAPFVPTPHEVASQLLKLGRLAPGETVCDLGCGDGRLLTLAVRKFGARRAIGYELDESLVAAARSDAAGDPRIDVRLGDASSAAEALAESDIVTLPQRQWQCHPPAASAPAPAAARQGLLVRVGDAIRRAHENASHARQRRALAPL